MTTLQEIIKTYEVTIRQTNSKLSLIKKKIYQISLLRVLFFVAGTIGIIHFFPAGIAVCCLIFSLTFIPFLLLIKYHNQLFYKKDYLEKKIEICKDEVAGIRYDLSNFDGGKEFIDLFHLYSFDLDLFGDHSLFQAVNRTSTFFGKKKLANWFIYPLDLKSKIEERQKAINELSTDISFCQHFRILGLLYKGKGTDEKEIKEWIKSQNSFSQSFFLKTFVLAVPIINAILWILAILNIISFNWPGLVFIFFILCSLIFQKRITKFQTSYGKKLKILSTYAELMKMVENREMTSFLLKDLQERLKNNQEDKVEAQENNSLKNKTQKKKSAINELQEELRKNVTASTALKHLSNQMNLLDQRNNILITAILDGLLFWQIRQVIRIEKWKKLYALFLMKWLEVIGEIDALCSLSIFAYNHPDYIYPTIAEKPFVLKAKALGHPLMEHEKCIRNDINIPKKPYFIIITGANMAGKSTYLRTIGINYLLACIGAPVCCKEMEIYPAHLITSLRTTDSLTKNESYFFAELKRLKLIIDKLESGEELFIILDEILKGTNSIDKQKGSVSLLKQFMRLKANGIIATHDLSLGQLAELYSDNIRNYRFEADICKNELNFSYRLQEGIAQNMNACFLMKKMGIVLDE